jgi:endonuclease III
LVFDSISCYLTIFDNQTLMKNSKEYARKVQKLYRSLKRKYPKVQQPTYDEPVDAIVYATLSENMSETSAQSAIKRFADYFVDLNDLRVSQAEEIIELLGGDVAVSRQISATLTKTLTDVFNQYHTVSLMALRKTGKRPAKHALEKLDNISNFVINYCMLTALQGHAIPLTLKMIDYLKTNELVAADAYEQQIEGFLTRQISAKNGYEFYALLRHESESPVTARKRKRKTKKKSTRKTRATKG